MEIGFDLIGDLNLTPEESFDWEGKVTSLYCLIAGNISDDLQVVKQTLEHLSNFYQGVFYVPGVLEYKTCSDHSTRTVELASIIREIPNVVFLFQHVVIIDGMALFGANGWSIDNFDDINVELINSRIEDIIYMKKSVEKLQRHIDVKSILVLTSCVPGKHLYFGKIPTHVEEHLFPESCLQLDSEMKVTHWAFGGSNTITNTIHNDVTYTNNPYTKTQPYWPARISVEV